MFSRMLSLFSSEPKDDHDNFSYDVYPLHLLDQWVDARSFIMNYTFRYDQVLDANKLHASLVQLVEKEGWRKLGGRLRINNAKKAEIHVPKTFTSAHPAVRFENSQIPLNIDAHPVAGRLPKGTGTAPSVHNGSDQFSTLSLAPSHPRSIRHYLATDEPVLGLYVTNFKDATLVGITIPHCLADAMATSDLLEAWSAIVSQRADLVKPLAGAKDDPFGSVGTPSDELAQGKFVQENYQMRGLRLLLFFGRIIWDKLTAGFVRPGQIYLSATYLASLRKVAEEELSKGRKSVPFISDGDLLTAWASRVIEKSSPATGTTAIYTIFSVRWRLGNTFKRTAAYMQNTVLPCVVLLSHKESKSISLGEVALRVREQIVAQTTETQVRRLVRIAREWVASLGITPIFSFWDSRLVVCTNWTKARFFDVADFGSAAVDLKEASGEVKSLGKPSFFWSIAISESDNLPNTFMVYGKDEAGNYWVSANLRDVTWRTIEREFGAFKCA
ncbi:hypothetical protein S40293_04888 [Stachybotrys chartarum IBT 40293]|nr:hypothetical protein S40293_04888 [Stachybotrys chartarum IBT 40293]